MNRHRRGHLDPDVLAEFRAGLIAGRRGRAIGAHVAACADCTAVDKRLAQVSALLAAAPVPPVPDALARRLDSALAAEALSSQRPSVQSPSPRRAPSWLRVRVLATAAAAVAALGGVGYALASVGPRTTYSGANASSGSGSSAAARPFANGGPSTFNGSRREASGDAAGDVVIVSSPVNYQPATLRSQLEAQLQQSPTASGTPASAQVSACVLRLTANRTPRLVESARYAGAPAYVIVASGTGGEQAWVTSLTCSATDSHVLSHVVLSSGISAP